MANTDQAALWNGHAGHAWVELQAMLDRLWRPVEDRLVQAAAGVQRVLDVGCGTGATTLAIARGGAACTGIDISEPMIALAYHRAKDQGLPARFVVADAQVQAFEPASFDAVVSRFGVMFFDDPVRAFANLRVSTRDGGRLCAVVWRSAAENPFMTTAERAAAPLIDLPPRKPGAPGQFGWADAARVAEILQAGGWQDVSYEPFDFDCALPRHDLETYVTQLGPVGVALQNVDATARERIVGAVRAAFEPFMQGDKAHFSAACAVVRARAA